VCKEYKNYDTLEGKVEKAITKYLGNRTKFSVAGHMIAMDIWSRTTSELRVPTDKDISIGLLEFFGSNR
jgi:hypothetical protein